MVLNFFMEKNHINIFDDLPQYSVLHFSLAMTDCWSLDKWTMDRVSNILGELVTEETDNLSNQVSTVIFHQRLAHHIAQRDKPVKCPFGRSGGIVDLLTL